MYATTRLCFLVSITCTIIFLCLNPNHINQFGPDWDIVADAVNNEHVALNDFKFLSSLRETMPNLDSNAVSEYVHEKWPFMVPLG